jgi:hypothetical protein
MPNNLNRKEIGIAALISALILSSYVYLSQRSRCEGIFAGNQLARYANAPRHIKGRVEDKAWQFYIRDQEVPEDLAERLTIPEEPETTVCRYLARKDNIKRLYDLGLPYWKLYLEIRE